MKVELIDAPYAISSVVFIIDLDLCGLEKSTENDVAENSLPILPLTTPCLLSGPQLPTR